MKVTIEVIVNEPSKKGAFEEIVLKQVENDTIYTKNILFNFPNLYQYTTDKESIAFDFLLLSVIIYNVDRFVSRNKYSLEGWTRDIDLVGVPVNNIERLNSVKNHINHYLSFLTGDHWNISFQEKIDFQYSPKTQSNNLFNSSDIEKVCLFSGGMDSLIGAINLLETNQKIILSSHFDLGKERKDQNNLIPELLEEYTGKFLHFPCKVGLGKKTHNSKVTLEATFRSRSLLFLGQGLYLAYNTNNSVETATEIIIPENGTISLNIPLSPSRRSSCSTRTTHPYFIDGLNQIFKMLGIHNQIRNPHELQTKGEMITTCRNKEFLKRIIKNSVSCAKGGHSRSWDEAIDSSGHKKGHCGMCMPCFYRRAALFYDGIDIDGSERHGTNVLYPTSFNVRDLGQKRSNDLRALCKFIKALSLDEKNIERELLINGVTDLKKIKDYADLVRRSYDQMKAWLLSSNREDIKRLLGVN